MDAVEDLRIEEDAGRSLPPRNRIEARDLTLLVDAIKRWDEFLQKVYVVPTAEYLTADVLEQLSLEDTEFYLDVKIQLTQCVRAVNDATLKEKLEDVCGRIRNETYHHITSTLPQLADNSRSLIELAHQDGRVLSGEGVYKLDWVPSPDLMMSQEYKDCLVQERKQLKAEIIRQRAKVKSQIVRLLKIIREKLHIHLG